MHSPLAKIGAAALGLFLPVLSLQADDLVFRNASPASTLVELYSSEGCSSCPPAEAWIGNLKKAPGLWKDLYPVVFHVDYWDDLGWPDRFAKPAYTQRQYDLASRLGQDSVYTPEFVVDGREWKQGWFRGQRLPAGPATAGELALTVGNGGRTASARYTVGNGIGGGPLVLNVALLGFNRITDVKRGENGGRKLDHDFVVLGFNTVPLVADAGASTFQSAPVALQSTTGDAPGAVVAWVEGKDGAVLQMAGGWLGGVP